MSLTGLTAFDHTLSTTNAWLKELMEDLRWDDRQRAYHALRAVLHTLRDRLTVPAAAAQGAQLPQLVRGVYYEGWRPTNVPQRVRHRDAFLAPVAAAFTHDPPADPEVVTRAVFRLLARHVAAGEIEHIERALPEELRGLWR
jgi:uncharacterized protein (DUF2267 family)